MYLAKMHAIAINKTEQLSNNVQCAQKAFALGKNALHPATRRCHAIMGKEIYFNRPHEYGQISTHQATIN